MGTIITDTANVIDCYRQKSILIMPEMEPG